MLYRQQRRRLAAVRQHDQRRGPAASSRSRRRCATRWPRSAPTRRTSASCAIRKLEDPTRRRPARRATTPQRHHRPAPNSRLPAAPGQNCNQAAVSAAAACDPDSDQTTYGSWFDAARAGDLGRVTKPATRRSSRVDGTDFDPTGRRTSATVYRWIDQTEDGSTTARRSPIPSCARTPTGSTPIGRSLFYARMYFENYVKAPRTPNNKSWTPRRPAARTWSSSSPTAPRPATPRRAAPPSWT